MRRTSLGRLVLAAGWVCFPVALAVGSIAPALLGLVLVAIVVGERPPAVVVSVARAIPREAVEGEPIEVVTTATAPRGASLALRTRLPPDAELVAATSEPGRGSARVVERVVHRHPGAAAWGEAIVHVRDPWGLVEDEVVVPLRDVVRVLPDTEGVRAGRQAGRKRDVGVETRRRIATDWEPEIERLRDYQPGDRVRDIDWAHSTKLSKLIAREMSRHSLLPVVVLLQATDSTRTRRRASKLDTGVQAALGVMSAAQAAGLATGLVAFDDRGVAVQVDVSASREAVTRALHRLADLKPALPQASVAAPAPEGRGEELAPGQADRAFLTAVGAFDARAALSATPLEAALGAVGRVSPQPALVIAILDVEESPALAGTVVSRLARRGHRSVVAGYASGAHHFAFEDVDDRAMDLLVAWRANRERAARDCARERASFVPLLPHVSAQSIRSVVRSAR